MKRNAFHFGAVALLPFLVAGCFSRMVGMGEAFTEPDPAAKRTAAVLDVATAPVQLPFWLGSGRSEASWRKQAEQDRRLMTLLESDPEIGIEQRWDQITVPVHGKAQSQPDFSRRRVFMASFSNPNVNYTLEQVEGIYRDMPELRAAVLCSRAWPSEFLVSHFDEAYQKAATHESCGALASLVSNPNTPIDLVEKVAANAALPGGATLAAQQALSQRRTVASPLLHP
jgi:hypothetical protein